MSLNLQEHRTQFAKPFSCSWKKFSLRSICNKQMKHWSFESKLTWKHRDTPNICCLLVGITIELITVLRISISRFTDKKIVTSCCYWSDLRLREGKRWGEWERFCIQFVWCSLFSSWLTMVGWVARVHLYVSLCSIRESHKRRWRKVSEARFLVVSGLKELTKCITVDMIISGFPHRLGIRGDSFMMIMHTGMRYVNPLDIREPTSCGSCSERNSVEHRYVRIFREGLNMEGR